jgi:hypothetical protein
MKLRQPPPGGWKNAKCLGFPSTQDSDPFFDEEDNTEAMNFCNGRSDGIICPIRHECLIFALVNNERYGVWGGMSETGRKAVRRKYPPRNRKVREEWQWEEESVILEGVDIKKLMEEEDE